MRRVFRIRDAGFTLIEIMIALSILAIGLVSIYVAQGNSLRASGSAESIRIATMLAEQKMAERMIELQKEIEKGSFPDEDSSEEGEFEEPFRRYRWKFSVYQVKIPVVETSGTDENSGSGTSEAATQVPEAVQRSMAQMISKKVSELVREIRIQVLWEELGEEQSLTVTTHIARLR